MKKFLPVIIVLIIIGALLGSTYNKLTALEIDVDQSWAQVENTLKRRADLIPNIVNTVKGYAQHEAEVLTKVTEARSAISNAKTPEEFANANEQLNEVVRSINVVVEAYPELKANEGFLNLQVELEGTENRIATERKRYNDNVAEFNRAVKRFPTNIMAGIIGFGPKQYFEISEKDAEVPQVSF